jgi:hypothetical protein
VRNDVDTLGVIEEVERSRSWPGASLVGGPTTCPDVANFHRILKSLIRNGMVQLNGETRVTSAKSVWTYERTSSDGELIVEIRRHRQNLEEETSLNRVPQECEYRSGFFRVGANSIAVTL